jgi:hypothetical protein
VAAVPLVEAAAGIVEDRLAGAGEPLGGGGRGVGSDGIRPQQSRPGGAGLIAETDLMDDVEQAVSDEGRAAVRRQAQPQRPAAEVEPAKPPRIGGQRLIHQLRAADLCPRQLVAGEHEQLVRAAGSDEQPAVRCDGEPEHVAHRAARDVEGQSLERARRDPQAAQPAAGHPALTDVAPGRMAAAVVREREMEVAVVRSEGEPTRIEPLKAMPRSDRARRGLGEHQFQRSGTGHAEQPAVARHGDARRPPADLDEPRHADRSDRIDSDDRHAVRRGERHERGSRVGAHGDAPRLAAERHPRGLDEPPLHHVDRHEAAPFERRHEEAATMPPHHRHGPRTDVDLVHPRSLLTIDERGRSRGVRHDEPAAVLRHGDIDRRGIAG